MSQEKSRMLGFVMARELSEVETEIITGGHQYGTCQDADMASLTTWCAGDHTAYQDDCT